MRLVSGWRFALRLASREALRARGRSLLVIVLIALPVTAVCATDVIVNTVRVSGSEGLSRRLGSAQARLEVQPGVNRVSQTPDPESGGSATSAATRSSSVTLSDVERVLGHAVPVIERREATVRVRVRDGLAEPGAVELDLRSPLAKGLFRLTSGRLPRNASEVVVNQALAAQGPTVGHRLRLSSGTQPRIVGVAESTTERSAPMAAGPPHSLRLPATPGSHTWLIGGPPVTWRTVLALNRVGVTVLSRQVLSHPPPVSQIPVDVRPASTGFTDIRLQIALLVVAMALLEVVLLAGPAFAVGARRQTRTLALLAASGGTPRQARRVVLAGAVVLGGACAVLGIGLGVVVARLAQPILQGLSGSWFGPFDLRWPQLLAIGFFGLGSALLAAVVPARLASRQDVVAVLAGRRGDRRPGVRSPLAGGVLLGLGVAGAVVGARSVGNGGVLIAASALLSVLGMILLVPLVLALLSRSSRRLPLALRYAVRDAARHRTRTVPAIAAVAATVAGVVALGVANTSDARQISETYSPPLPIGQAALTDCCSQQAPDWPRLRAATQAALPDARVTPVAGVSQNPDNGTGTGSGAGVMLGFDSPRLHGHAVSTYGGALPAQVLVSAPGLPPGLDRVSPVQAAGARQVLKRGGVVVFTDHAVPPGPVRVTGQLTTADSPDGHPLGPLTAPAYFIARYGNYTQAQAVLSPKLANRLGLKPTTVGLVLTGATPSKTQEQQTLSALHAIDPGIGLYVERGPSQRDTIRIVLLVLGILGGVLMLGGTLTATFLALSDARGDLSTLGAVGASPKTRRAVAAAYALVVGGVGSVLGTILGFVPGLAAGVQLTSSGTSAQTLPSGAPVPDAFLAVPWIFVGVLVVGLPLLTAVVVGLGTRARLPMVTRLE